MKAVDMPLKAILVEPPMQWQWQPVEVSRDVTDFLASNPTQTLPDSDVSYSRSWGREPMFYL